jgi:hypothetical protein
MLRASVRRTVGPEVGVEIDQSGGFDSGHRQIRMHTQDGQVLGFLEALNPVGRA